MISQQWFIAVKRVNTRNASSLDKNVNRYSNDVSEVKKVLVLNFYIETVSVVN